ncbi:MAG: DUF2752 domain-containing protein [Nocardioidaceae bacterium]
MAAPSAEIRAALFRPSTGPSTGLVAAVGLLGVVVAAVIDPSQAEHGPVVCPFRLATGLPCPGCGLTRSWVFALHGRIGSSVAANPFGVVLLASTMVLAGAVVAALVRGRPLPDLGRVLSSRAARATVTAWLIFGLVRLILVASGVVSG